MPYTPAILTPASPAAAHPAMVDYLQHLVLRGKVNTARNAQSALERFTAWCQAQRLPPLQASTADLSAYQEWLVTTYRSAAGQPLGWPSAAGYITNLKSWYRWCAARDLVLVDPSTHLRMRVVRSRVVLATPLTLQEVSAMLQTQAGVVASLKTGSWERAVALRDLAALALGLATGRRVAGVAHAVLDQFDEARGELRVDREKGVTGRVLPIATWAVEILSQYRREVWAQLARGTDCPWLFPGQRSVEPLRGSMLNRMIKQVVARTCAANPDLDELPHKHISWHTLRVSFATLLFANGCDIRSVNELLLHRKLSTTARYTPIPVDDLRRRVQSIHPRP